MTSQYMKMLESARMRAKARSMSFNRKMNGMEDKDVENFKRDMLKIWMEYPEIFQGLMKVAPNELNSLIQKYIK